MRQRSSKFSSASLIAAGVLVLLAPRRATAQACCAGTGAVTPGRLAVHEDALIAVQARASHVYASFDSGGHYGTPPNGSSEQDFEEDVIGSLRLPVIDRAQLAVLVPFVETHRSARGKGEAGGGFGDINLSARYDFLYAVQRRWVPGIAALSGITFPSGRSPESATHALATDSTGVGAYQGNFGIAVEQLFGPFLVTAYGIVAKRASRTADRIRSTLGTQWSALASVAYALPHDYAMALSASYSGEGDAEVEGAESPGSARRITTLGLTGVVPVTDHFRLQGGFSGNPPIPQLGKNQPATVGLLVTALYAWY